MGGEPTVAPEGASIVYRTTEAFPDSAGMRGLWFHDQPMPGGYSLNPPEYDSYAGGVNVDTTSSENPTLDVKFQPINAEKVFGAGVIDTIKTVLQDSAVRLIGQNKQVQEQIEKQKVEVGKEALWKYIPFILVGTVLTALIIRFK